MAGGFTCPYCDNFNRCCCKRCKETYLSKGLTDNFVTWDNTGELCICAKCNKTFHEAQSLDIEWERMLVNIGKILTKEVCYEWLFNIIKSEDQSSDYKEYRQKVYDMYKKYGYTEDWFNRMFALHYKENSYDIRKSGLSALRDLQISKIMDITD